MRLNIVPKPVMSNLGLQQNSTAPRSCWESPSEPYASQWESEEVCEQPK